MLENIKIMNMKRVLFIVAAAAMTLTSCVSLSEMEALQAKYDQTSKKYNLTQQELLEMKEENAELSRVNQSLSSEMTDMALAKASAEARADSSRSLSLSSLVRAVRRFCARVKSRLLPAISCT